MNKLILGLFLCMLLVGQASAAGTCLVTTQDYLSVRTHVITWSCTADAADGSYPATTAPAIVGNLHYVEVDPGATAPTALYDITLTDANSNDVLGETHPGNNRSATVTERFYAVTTAGDYISPFISSALTLNIINNAVHSATTVVRAIIVY